MTSAPDLRSHSVLVTGAAGFIGFHLAQRLLAAGATVRGIDNLNSYYDVDLKRARLARLIAHERFAFAASDITDYDGLKALFADCRPHSVVHLAAQAGVRHSLEAPRAYVSANLDGFLGVLEACRAHAVGHLVYASSSSVYGANRKVPFHESDPVLAPVSLYGATKRANELMAEAYARLFSIPSSGVRFFTVYGPWGRPDMALFMFTRNILEGKPIDVFNHGHHRRDFTYVEDIAEGVIRVCERIAQPDPAWRSDAPDPATSSAPYRLYNIGNHQPVQLLRYIEVIEECLGRKAQKNFLPLQLGDVPDTFADIEDLVRDVGYRPATPIEVGVRNFVAWFCEYYGYKR